MPDDPRPEPAAEPVNGEIVRDPETGHLMPGSGALPGAGRPPKGTGALSEYVRETTKDGEELWEMILKIARGLEPSMKPWRWRAIELLVERLEGRIPQRSVALRGKIGDLPREIKIVRDPNWRSG
jgi:hypothetical protein